MEPGPESAQRRQRDPAERRRVKRRGIVLATGGLLLALGLVLGLDAVGFLHANLRSWLTALLVTLAVQGALWFLPGFDIDERITGDRRYLYLPMLAAAALLSVYIYIAPGARYLLLMAWFVALLFMAGFAGMMEVVVLSTAMTVGYMGALGLRARTHPGSALSFAQESLRAGVFLAINVYAGVVFQRLRRERRERGELRRRLTELALTDPLTGLRNRRYFEEFLRSELARIARYGGMCSVAMLDVDHFKNYNDTLGHLAGDEVLRQLAGVLLRQMRVSDVVARIGGEEFGIILVNTARTEARPVIERLHRLIHEHPFPREDVQPGRQLTVSTGIASCPADATDYEGLLGRADEALYAAKAAGRDRIHVAA